jgi:hypothetical protein
MRVKSDRWQRQAGGQQLVKASAVQFHGSASKIVEINITAACDTALKGAGYLKCIFAGASRWRFVAKHVHVLTPTIAGRPAPTKSENRKSS